MYRDRQSNELSTCEITFFRQKMISAVWISVSAVVGLMLLWFAAELFLLAFLCILFAIVIRSLSNPLAGLLHLPERLSLWIVIALISGGLYLTGYLFSDDVISQFEELSKRLPQALTHLQDSVNRSELGRKVMDEASEVGEILKRPGVLSRATQILSATFGFLSGILIVIVAGIFFAYNPSLYLEGVFRLFHPHRRGRIREVIEKIHHTMRWWIIGKSIEIVFVGTITGIGLQVLGVKLALILGIIAGLFAFIPYIGPLMSALPAILLALVEGPQNALYVIILYIGVQGVEGNVVTPIIERKTVYLPPALTIFSQLLAALLFGFLGVLLASPLTVVGMILVKMLYIEDVLEHHKSSPA